MFNKVFSPLALVAAFALCGIASAQNAKEQTVRISTDETDLILQVGSNGRLYQKYLGPKLADADEAENTAWAQHGASARGSGWEVYGTNGNEDYFEPALSITHSDGNMGTYLYYQSHETEDVEGGRHTSISLADDKYPVNVTLHYVAYAKENVIKTWTEVSHNEKKTISLWNYASAMLYQDAGEYWLTEFSGDWAKEVGMSSQQLQFGKKIIDTKLGSRAGMFVSPFFELGMDGPVAEDHGTVLIGTLGWTGNFRFTFEVDNEGCLRILPGINPYASSYELKAGENFVTPEFVFTLSSTGAGQGSRNLHDWARNYSVKDGKEGRMTLLNNWENTGFNFNQDVLAGLMKEARDLGVDMFLLDDGWFGNKYPRKNDGAGLGDWEVTHDKLPGGIPALVDSAKAAGVKFGIWIEPEMVNPKSELFEKHPEWAIMQPNRKTYYYRNQLVLDMSNPEVQDHVFGVVDRIMTENPDVAYFKWDCNSPITNVYSPYAGKKQGQFYIDHVRGIYKVLQRVKEKYPQVPMMLCSGGGARCDYEALKYFTEFWCSDNTDPVERIFIQWGFSQVFPAKVMAAHVTSWNSRTSVKFRTDVASMCKLGFDIGLKRMSGKDLEYCREAVKNWKALAPAIMDGDQYRLVSPYDGEHAAVNYVSKDKNMAVLFAYNLAPRFGEKIMRVKMQGLDPAKSYMVEEINLMPGVRSNFRQNGKKLSGDYLMKVGLDALSGSHYSSKVIRLRVAE